jgi:hypothetical protein
VKRQNLERFIDLALGLWNLSTKGRHALRDARCIDELVRPRATHLPPLPAIRLEGLVAAALVLVRMDELVLRLTLVVPFPTGRRAH